MSALGHERTLADVRTLSAFPPKADINRSKRTNDPTSIGRHVSSDCIRLTNDNVIDLYNRVKIGTKVIVLPMEQPRTFRPRRVSKSGLLVREIIDCVVRYPLKIVLQQIPPIADMCGALAHVRLVPKRTPLAPIGSQLAVNS